MTKRRTAEETAELMEQAKKYLSHPVLSPPMIAKRLGYNSYSSFSRVFKAHAGYAPGNYRSLRLSEKDVPSVPRSIQKARKYLRFTKKPEGDIAKLCGYANVSSFFESFKFATGLAPKAFRLQYRPDECPDVSAEFEEAKELLKTTDLKVWEVVKGAGYAHKVGMYNDFRRELGLTPKAFRLQYRPDECPDVSAEFEEAKELLKTTDLKVWEVAKKAGYAHKWRMVNDFRQELDLTPTQYRQQAHVAAAVKKSEPACQNT